MDKTSKTEPNQELLRQLKDEKILIKIPFDDLRRYIPGYGLNNCEPGSDGAIYFIERNLADKYCWDLYKCCKIEIDNNVFTKVEKSNEKFIVEKLYSELERVDIYLLGYEAIALGLPYHIDPYGIN